VNAQQPQIINVDPNFLRNFPWPGSSRPFKFVTQVLSKQKCNQCNEHSLEPLIIPPTWSKSVNTAPALKSVWKQAIEELRTAFQLIVIGYSMPTTDTFFQYLLTLGLEQNPHLSRVVVVNLGPGSSTGAPQDDPKLEQSPVGERYRKVFSRSLSDRDQLKFVAKKFEDFASRLESYASTI
jgi:hypothetical protein